MLENLRRLPIEVLERFLEIRDAKKCGIPLELANYILQINEAHNLHRRYRSITTCANVLRKKCVENGWKNLSIPTCKSRIFDAITFFTSDCTVTSAAWDHYYADELENLKDVALVARDLGMVYKCTIKAREFRKAASANIVDPNRQRFRYQLVTPDLTMARMGVRDSVGLLKAYEEGLQIIATREASQTDKDRLEKDLSLSLGIGKYVEYVEIKDDEGED